MSSITCSEYQAEVLIIAQCLAEEAMEQNSNDRFDAEEVINDRLLHETVDGHQWVIYYSYNLDVYNHSDNQDYAVDNLGGDYLCSVLSESGLEGMHSVLAFWCLYADVQGALEDALDNVENNLAERV